MSVAPPADPPRPLQRFVMVTGILSAAGPVGRPAGELADAVGFRGTPESRREQLARCIRDLQAVGVDIANIAEPGSEARWVLRPADSRVRVAFTPDQQAELARAALLMDRSQSGSAEPIAIHPPELPPDVDRVLRAVTARCRLHFNYNGRSRTLDPVTMLRGFGGWAVAGIDRSTDQYRTYYLRRMSDVTTGPPGSAGEPGSAPRRGTDPLTWRVDPPLGAMLEVLPDHEADTEQLLGQPDRRADGHWEYLVTNRWAFFARLTELGERVRLSGPDPLRQQFAHFLRQALP